VYFLDPQQALKAATASVCSIPLMRSIVLADIDCRTIRAEQGSWTTPWREKRSTSFFAFLGEFLIFLKLLSKISWFRTRAVWLMWHVSGGRIGQRQP